LSYTITDKGALGAIPGSARRSGSLRAGARSFSVLFLFGHLGSAASLATDNI
jgi:hypothetical protein